MDFIYIRKNSTDVAVQTNQVAENATITRPTYTSTIVKCVKGDVLSVRTKSEVANNLSSDVQSQINIERIK